MRKKQIAKATNPTFSAGEMKHARSATNGDEEEVKRSREDIEHPVDENWLLETFRGVVHSTDVSFVLSKLHLIAPRLKVGGLVEIGLAEADKKFMERAGVHPVVCDAIERYAKERKATAASSASLDGSNVALKDISYPEFEQLLATIPMVPETSTIHPEEQLKLLGPFYRPGHDLPLIRNGDDWYMDAEFLPSLLRAEENSIRPSAEMIRMYIERGFPYHVMLAVSGSGKTSAIADLARFYFVLYIQCTSPQENESLRKSPGYDAGFAQMVGDFMVGPHVDDHAKRAKQAFVVELTCRLAQVFRLVQLKPDVTPFEFYIHQRMVGDEWMEELRSTIRFISLENCQLLIREMRRRLDEVLAKHKLVLAVDEIEVASSYLVNSFDMSKQKGFLSPMLQAIASLDTSARWSVILSGTRCSLEHSLTTKSGLNKPSSLLTYEEEVPQMFPHVTAKACKRLLNYLKVDELLDVEAIHDDAEFDPNWSPEDQPIEELLNYAVVGSRFRTLTRILDNLVKVRRAHDLNLEEKRAVLRTAILQSITGFKDDLVYKLSHEGGYREGNESTRLNAILVKLWTGLSLNGSEMMILVHGCDLMQLGVGNYTSIRDTYRVSEPIVTLAISEYFHKHSDRINESSFVEAQDAFAALLGSHGNIPAKGNLLKNLVFHALLKPEFKDKKIADLPFVRPFLPNTTGQKWWHTTTFCADRCVGHHTMQQTTPSFLASQEAIGVVYSPERVARFDACLKLDEAHAMTFAVTLWSSTVPREKVVSQLLSTDMRLTYYTSNGLRVNPRCKTRCTEWDTLGLTKVHAIRVHIALPSFVKSGLNAVRINSEEELGVHLDLTNYHLLLGEDKELMKLLEIATNHLLE